VVAATGTVAPSAWISGRRAQTPALADEILDFGAATDPSEEFESAVPSRTPD
jgi:hypothetical protein